MELKCIFDIDMIGKTMFYYLREDILILELLCLVLLKPI